MENIEKLQQLLLEKYNYIDGELVYKNTNRGIKKDKVAGFLNSKGYKQIKLNNKNYLVHRLIFLYHNGYLPEMIAHIDNNKLNNRIENLKETNMESILNKKVKSNSKSKIKNVYYNESKDSYQVYMNVNGERKSFGYYKDLSMAKYIAEFIYSKKEEITNVTMLRDMAKYRYMDTLYIDNNS